MNAQAMRERCEINFGATRAVLLIGGLAFKLPRPLSWKHFLLGLIANMQEVTFSAAKWPELCPVLWSIPGGFLVVMRRARPLTQDEFDAIEIPDWLEKGDYYVPMEAKIENFGMLDGRVVAVDYGN